MPLQKTKFRFSHNEEPWKYKANLQNKKAEVWPRQNCIAALLKSHFGMETTQQPCRLLLVRRPTKDCFWKENRKMYEFIYIFKRRIYQKNVQIHNMNMKKYCAKNLNARYRLSFKYSRDDVDAFSWTKFDFIQHMYLHWHYFINNSSKWSVKTWRNWKIVIIEIDWWQRTRER